MFFITLLSKFLKNIKVVAFKDFQLRPEKGQKIRPKKRAFGILNFSLKKAFNEFLSL